MLGLRIIVWQFAPTSAVGRRSMREMAMQMRIGRRAFLRGAGAVAVLGAFDGCRLVPGRGTTGAPLLQLSPLRASIDRITRVTVCTRPFRAQGPRLDVEMVG